jgi:phosphohistidine swiveling domain-containing protein
MWKIYLCGCGVTKRQEGEVNWHELLRHEFKDKYLILEPTSNNFREFTSSEKASLDKFFSGSHKHALLSRLSGIDEADLVIANASIPAFDVFVQILYAHLLRKPILIFTDNEVPSQETIYVSAMADLFSSSFEELVKYLQEMKVVPQTQHSMLRDISFMGVQKDITNIFSKEDRKDALFRAAILTTQIGQLQHYLTHDRQINPAARVVGSRADEEAQLGDCLIQLLIYCLSRSFNIDEVYSIGILRMQEAVWRSTQPEIVLRELRPSEIGYGISASSGEVTGRVVIIRTMEDVSKINEGKCIVAIPEYQKSTWDEITARIENVLGLISGTGTPNIHPAIICRELKKPCIVGARDLVAKLKENEFVRMKVGIEMDDNSVVRVNQL